MRLVIRQQRSTSHGDRRSDSIVLLRLCHHYQFMNYSSNVIFSNPRPVAFVHLHPAFGPALRSLGVTPMLIVTGRLYRDTSATIFLRASHNGSFAAGLFL